MVFFANLCVNLHVCLCGDPEVASAQERELLDIKQTETGPSSNRRHKISVAQRRMCYDS